jgi:hypothetical protein
MDIDVVYMPAVSVEARRKRRAIAADLEKDWRREELRCIVSKLPKSNSWETVSGEDLCLSPDTKELYCEVRMVLARNAALQSLIKGEKHGGVGSPGP